MFRLFVAVPILFGVVGCLGFKKTYFVHPEYGRVDSTDSRYKADSDLCGKEAYSKGINIYGKTYTDRDQVIKIVIDNVVHDSRVEGKFDEPHYWQDYAALENETRECTRKKGWVLDKRS